jgi:transposase
VHIKHVIEPYNIACHSGCGDMVKIEEDNSKWLDVIFLQYQVIVTIRPKYVCPKVACRGDSYQGVATQDRASDTPMSVFG